MELIRGIYSIRPRFRECVAAIGNFDGVHRGHQHILQHLAEQARELQLPMVVIIFEPQPQEYFAAHKAPARLTRLREKLVTFKQLNVDRVLCLHFNQAFSQLTPQQFIQQLLVDGLAVRYLVVGDDFRFGCQRTGDFAALQQAGKHFGFQVETRPAIVLDGQRISSTRVREALAAGDLQYAETLLGRPYGMCGRVAHGDKRGRSIGFPTANIYLHRHLSPIAGVYAVKVFGLGENAIFGVANVGNRPTVDGTRSLLEVHLFDFDKTIYGHYVRVDFIHKLRDEIRFDSFELLKAQIARDVIQAKQFFNLEQ